MDFDMQDADSVAQMSQADELEHLSHSSDKGTPEPSNEPDNDSDTSNSDEAEPPEPDPNDLFKDDIKEYESTTLVLIDAPEAQPVDAHGQNESHHEHACHLMEITFRNISNFTIVKICLPPNSTEADFITAINGILHGKTEKDFLIFHYHGSAGGVDHQYKWRFEGHPRSVNAYNFIGKLCNSRPDSLLILDTYVHDKIEDMWELNTGNVEIFTLKCKIQNAAGNLIHADPGYVTQGVCRNLRAWLAGMVALRRTKVMDKTPRTIPQVWGKDYTIKSKTTRIWFNHPRKENTKTILRFKIDPLDAHDLEKIVFKAYCISPPRPPPPLPATPEPEPVEDEGFEESEEATSTIERADSVMGGMPSSAGSDHGSDDGSDDSNDLFVDP